MKAFITGVGGFAGSHLADLLLSQGHEVSGLVQPGASTQNLRHLAGRIALHEGDLLDAGRIEGLMRAERPGWVFHLAAQSSVHASWKDPAATFHANVTCGIRLLEACLPFREGLRAVMVTSAEIYGMGSPAAVTREESPFAPLNPYAVSKLALDLVAGQIAGAAGFPLVRMRPTNHAGPRQAVKTVLSRFACELARMEAGLQEPVLRAGNLDAWRDFADVRDVVRAYALAAGRGRAGGGYLVCTGAPRRVGDALELLLGMSRVKVRVERDPALERPADPPYGKASFARLEADTGWRPEIPFERTLRDTLDYWRGEVARKGK
ncbi:MAG: GDP-mannose 4,6-dehydratase [Candidatus Tectomicrobia bacterium]|uniref:GDP-mannose 4,6-dehydratase n=1 Tax=Tectimicrobiota bacterium TaxID=2528274 RepID=A0A932HZY4_UNCTE|nr:GDP-mannose 4,6-dehydratase [Candidatus Tectomicrobia bacterium]